MVGFHVVHLELTNVKNASFRVGKDKEAFSHITATSSPTFDKSHCDIRHSSFTDSLTVYVEKQPVA